MSLITKYRPRNLKEFIGNEHIIKPLTESLKREDPPHTYLFTGKSGCGKSSLARALSFELGIAPSNIYQYNSSDDRGMDTMREIIELSKGTTLIGGDKMFILEEANNLPNMSQNALLTLLEEPPKNCFFILCTTEPEALLPTIKRRCNEYKVKPLDRDQIRELLLGVLEQEKVKEPPKWVLDKIIGNCDGSPGVALKQLDMIVDLIGKADKELIEETIESSSSVVDNDAIRYLGNILCNIRLSGANRFAAAKTFLTPSKEELKNDTEELKLMRKTLDQMTPEAIRSSLCAYMANALWNHPLPVLEGILDSFIEPWTIPGKAALKLSIFRSSLFDMGKATK